MPRFSLPDDVLCVAHHPSEPQFTVSLVTGHVYAYAYDLANPGERTLLYRTRRHRRACRCVSYAPDGRTVVTVGVEGVIKLADSRTGQVRRKWTDVHAGEAINVVAWINAEVFCTGDDAGVIKAWDVGRSHTAKEGKGGKEDDDEDDGAARTFRTHEDYISHLLPLDGKFVLATSGDGTLSVHDLRTTSSPGQSKDKTVEFSAAAAGLLKKETRALVKRSDDQEDDLTCAALIKTGRKRAKVIVGTGSGVLSIFNKGDWGDCNDRILPPKSPSSASTPGKRGKKKETGAGDDEIGVECLARIDDDRVVVGGSDGRVRSLHVLPNQYLRLVGDFERGEPVEGLTVFEGWVFAVSGTEVCIWSLEEVVETKDEREEEEEDEDEKVESSTKESARDGEDGESESESATDSGDDAKDDEDNHDPMVDAKREKNARPVWKKTDDHDHDHDDRGSDGDRFSDSDSDAAAPKRKKPKKIKPLMEGRKNTFFDDL